MLQDRNGFLHPEYPRIGWFFLPSSASVTTQRLPNRKGKCERVSLLPWKRNKTQSAAKKHLCGASSLRQRASHRQGAQRKQECWPGHFGRVQHQKTWEKKMVWMIPLRYRHPERVGHPQGATKATPYTQPGSGRSLSPDILPIINGRRGQLVFLLLLHVTLGKVKRFQKC